MTRYSNSWDCFDNLKSRMGLSKTDTLFSMESFVHVFYWMTSMVFTFLRNSFVRFYLGLCRRFQYVPDSFRARRQAARRSKAHIRDPVLAREWNESKMFLVERKKKSGVAQEERTARDSGSSKKALNSSSFTSSEPAPLCKSERLPDGLFSVGRAPGGTSSQQHEQLQHEQQQLLQEQRSILYPLPQRRSTKPFSCDEPRPLTKAKRNYSDASTAVGSYCSSTTSIASLSDSRYNLLALPTREMTKESRNFAAHSGILLPTSQLENSSSCIPPINECAEMVLVEKIHNTRVIEEEKVEENGQKRPALGDTGTWNKENVPIGGTVPRKECSPLSQRVKRENCCPLKENAFPSLGKSEYVSENGASEGAVDEIDSDSLVDVYKNSLQSFFSTRGSPLSANAKELLHKVAKISSKHYDGAQEAELPREAADDDVASVVSADMDEEGVKKPWSAPKMPSWSLGAEKHFSGTCSPCGFYYKKECLNGANCNYCHMCSKAELRRRKKEKVVQVRREEALKRSMYKKRKDTSQEKGLSPEPKSKQRVVPFQHTHHQWLQNSSAPGAGEYAHNYPIGNTQRSTEQHRNQHQGAPGLEAPGSTQLVLDNVLYGRQVERMPVAVHEQAAREHYGAVWGAHRNETSTKPWA